MGAHRGSQLFKLVMKKQGHYVEEDGEDQEIQQPSTSTALVVKAIQTVGST